MPPRNKNQNQKSGYSPIEFAELLQSSIYGQSDSINQLKDLYTLISMGIANYGSGPKGSILLDGPTGSGKTHTAKMFASLLHQEPNTDRCLLRINCGEYQLPHEVAKLVGSPPGYLGHKETRPVLCTGALAGVRSNISPIACILFDEIDKAHPDVAQALLGILDTGTMTTGDNIPVDFTNTLIWFSSNIGARSWDKSNMGLIEHKIHNSPKKASLELIQRHFSREFFNRLDYVLIYDPLTRGDLDKILLRNLEQFVQYNNANNELKIKNLIIEPPLWEIILNRGVNETYGARHLKRIMRKYILVPLAIFLNDTGATGETLILDWDGHKTIVSID